MRIAQPAPRQRCLRACNVMEARGVSQGVVLFPALLLVAGEVSPADGHTISRLGLALTTVCEIQRPCSIEQGRFFVQSFSDRWNILKRLPNQRYDCQLLAPPRMPRILLNTTTLNKGGALQTSLNFIQQLLQDPAEFTWRLALSGSVDKELAAAETKLPADTVVFERSPAKDRAMRQQLRALADEWRPDVVLTFSGPAYVKFAQPHLLGFSDGWVTHASWHAYRMLNFPIEMCKYWLLSQYKKSWLKTADRWITQTEAARQGLHRRTGLPLDKIAVITNTCGRIYHEAAQEFRPFLAADAKVRFFCFAAPYKHKNLKLLPEIASAFKKLEPQRPFEILITLPEGIEWEALQKQAARLHVSEHFMNAGQIPVAKGLDLYRTCDLLLLPTLLETFSGTYPEAMAMGLPIVTSDLDFARDTCQDAALYYAPHDAMAAARELQRLLRERSLWETLIAAGKQRLQVFPTPAARKELYYAEVRKLLNARSV
jgi:glycosyltransferase involved in cell wall biosynthesis